MDIYAKLDSRQIVVCATMPKSVKIGQMKSKHPFLSLSGDVDALQPSNAMKLIVVVIFSLSYIAYFSSPALAQDSIFATPTKTDKPSPGTFSTAQALLDATKSGEVPDALRNDDTVFQRHLSESVYLILQKEYGLNKDRMQGEPWGQQIVFGELLQKLTLFEFNDNKKEIAESFQSELNDIFGGPDAPGSYNFDRRRFEDSRAIFNKFAAQYTKAVKDSIAGKQQKEEQSQRDLAEQQHQADMQERLAAQERRHQDEQENEERRKQKELSDARVASQQAEDDIKTKARAAALDKAKEARKQKLADVLTSLAYKQWEAALVVQQGEKMISDAQKVLDHDDAVQRESGVTDLAARRAAGEQMVAGKSMVETAFDAYRKQGGKAITPKEVVAGPDPAADYR